MGVRRDIKEGKKTRGPEQKSPGKWSGTSKEPRDKKEDETSYQVSKERVRRHPEAGREEEC